MDGAEWPVPGPPIPATSPPPRQPTPPSGEQGREKLCVGLAGWLDCFLDRVLDAYMAGEGQQAPPMDPPQRLPRDDVRVRSVHEWLSRSEGGAGKQSQRMADRRESRRHDSQWPVEGGNQERRVEQQGRSAFELLGAQEGHLAFERLSGDRREAVQREVRWVDRLCPEEEDDPTYMEESRAESPTIRRGDQLADLVGELQRLKKHNEGNDAPAARNLLALSLFNQDILTYQAPKDFKAPNHSSYDGLDDPRDHLLGF